MKTIIAGSRDITDYETVRAAVDASGFHISAVVSGKARGVDRLGEQWAREYSVPVKEFPADWNRHGKAAGPIRNRQMADYAGALIAIWDGESHGTKDMIVQARKNNLMIYIHRV